ncbi:uncharacterized protein MONOS_2523 [Monocercomonoides exilis]|uniref:uncharacterized protein n=1 Tax=Monocercomonoides exilis TaxID=2049356 RepID=UPI00355A3632|nr:hypothetical protein MONOS_2523 [Monocercomonoides exilis]|eukprot:MONOS_2523.1-p1 / transcript=MONOS_2523.1 / gene=MONOS_2523 / organism=Monocercomonoides_exilis_PA203 / gene_product=unspecified product / transcript_product=unspecified product / location=Mono_scaffold00052:126001-126378(-) / protein_length=94 / sequence_SO=supercontig / SO=protein_coding / is_pseudo=false
MGVEEKGGKDSECVADGRGDVEYGCDKGNEADIMVGVGVGVGVGGVGAADGGVGGEGGMGEVEGKDVLSEEGVVQAKWKLRMESGRWGPAVDS